MSKHVVVAVLAQIIATTSPVVLAADGANYPQPILAQPENARQMLEQGLKLYQNGQFSTSVQILQQAALAFKTQKDVLNQALALNYIALAYLQLGQLPQASKAIADSLVLLPSGGINSKEYLSVHAQAFNTQGEIQIAQGQADKALASWKEANTLYTKNKDNAGEIGTKINQAEALQSLGLYRQAFITLNQVNQLLQKQPDPFLKATGLLSLGNALRVVGILDQKDSKMNVISQGIDSVGSQQVLIQSLLVASKINSPDLLAKIYLSLGNTAQALQNNDQALKYYQKAVSNSTSAMTRVEAQMNQLRLYLATGQNAEYQALLPEIQSQLETLPPSRKSVYVKINLAESLACLESTTGARGIGINMTCPKQQIKAKEIAISSSLDWVEIARILVKAVEQARSLGDKRAEAYALGTLGGVYEQTQQWSEAQKLTEQALAVAEDIAAPDISYRWQWQLGRILQAKNNRPGAIAAYTKAVNNLKSLRRDLVTINRNVQFSFREGVEPVYRELVSLLLQSTDDKDNQKNLDTARNIIESLKLAELDNFFRRACIDAKPVQIDQVDRTAAVIYPVILPNRLAVILSLPSSSNKEKKSQNLSFHQENIPREQVEQTLGKLRENLETRSSPNYLRSSKQVYDWIIRPIESELANRHVQNLVFVLDGQLGSIPMGALYDGKHFLVEKYNIAITQGLQLLNPQPLAHAQLRTLAGGLTEGRENFPELPAVKQELEEIKSTVPNTQVLLNEKFTTKAIENAVKSISAPVVHLATHGQFSSKAEDTYIVTHDGNVNVNELNSLLKTRETNQRGAIELLVLSACSTATGDKQAALGIAGVAVQSGARSTLASLWVVDDEATAIIMGEFYKQLKQKPNITKIEALKRAQLTLLRDPQHKQYRHPYYWAPYVLVGNWL